MAKGALEMKVMLSLILVVTIILLFMVYGKTLFERGDAYADDAECRQSVQQNALLRFGGTEFSSKINCPMNEVLVKNDEDLIRATVAEEMRKCWSTWGEGKLELFSADDKTFCAVCSVISFEEPGVRVTSLIPYLSQRVISGSDKTYFEYLTGTTEPTAMTQDLIETSQPLSVVFQYAQDKKLSEKPTFATYKFGYDSSDKWDVQLIATPYTLEDLRVKGGCNYFPATQTRTNTPITV